MLTRTVNNILLSSVMHAPCLCLLALAMNIHGSAPLLASSVISVNRDWNLRNFRKVELPV